MIKEIERRKTKMKAKMKTPKAENSKTLQAMKLYLIALCSLNKISNEDAAAWYKHIQFAENHPEILARADARTERMLKRKEEE